VRHADIVVDAFDLRIAGHGVAVPSWVGREPQRR
jgi:hypothetical protein